jgi:hypothetical protein
MPLPAAAAAVSALLLSLVLARAEAPAATAPLAPEAALGTGSWSAPATLAAGCGAAGAPQVAFPSASPQLSTGPGAIVWSSPPSRCHGGAAAAPRSASSLVLAALGPSERPTLTAARPLAGAFAGQLAVVGGSFGRLMIAADSRGPGAAVTVLQARAAQPLGFPALVERASLIALAHGYLGEAALATLHGATIAVHVERHYLRGFAPARLVHLPPGRVTALAVTLDFRSDVLLAWQQNGAVYADMLRASGRNDPVQQIGPSAPHPQLQALVSDNDHGVVAWSSPANAAPGSRTRTYIDLSAAGVRFGTPRLLASFPDPADAGRSPGSLALVRLSSENAIVAWTDARNGHYVVRGSPTVFAATRPALAISDPRAQAVLAGLAAGPQREAVALWTSPPNGESDPRAARTRLWASRTFVVPHDRLAERRPQIVAAPGVLTSVSLAVDPADDRPLVAWLARKAGGSIQYVVGGGPAGAAAALRPGFPSATGPHARAGTPWLALTLAAAGAAGAILLVRVGIARRLRQPGSRRGRR